MKFISTNSDSETVGLSEAVNCCVARDGGLFMPQVIPVVPRAFFNNIGEMSLREIAYVVASTFFGDDIRAAELKTIVDEAFDFDAPLVKVGDAWVLELFHGPTLTFKDYGARFMARLIRELDKRSGAPTRHILVATTGNTGAATANGMFGLPGIEVYVLYPKGRLNRMRRGSLTSLGGNIHPVEVAGTIEDCKRMVQEAIADPSLRHLNLTGANSINIARLLPQVTFAYHAYARLVAAGVENADKALNSIPCGNLGNLVAASMALCTGLPAGGLIAATNDNDGLRAVLSGNPADRSDVPRHTLAPGIDMTYPSGWPRLEALFQRYPGALAKDILAVEPVSDDEIARTITTLRHDFGYTIDPHGAVAYAAAMKALVAADVSKVVFATGHPTVQLDIMTQITGSALELPQQLTRFMKARTHAALIPPRMPALRKLLTNEKTLIY